MLSDEQKILMFWARLKSAIYMRDLIANQERPSPELLAKCRAAILHEIREWEQWQKFARIACCGGIEDAYLDEQIAAIKAGGK